MALLKEERTEIIKDNARSEGDTGSPEVQVAVLTRRITELTEHLYAQDFDRDSNTIEVFVGRLRKKIGADRIETVRGLGYRLTPLAGETVAD